MEEPCIESSDIFYLSSFWDLNSTRCFDMGFIPWDVRLKYAEHVGLDKENTKTFIVIISRLDNTYLTWIAKERDKNHG